MTMVADSIESGMALQLGSDSRVRENEQLQSHRSLLTVARAPASGEHLNLV
jgi:hypothetical protein